MSINGLNFMFDLKDHNQDLTSFNDNAEKNIKRKIKTAKFSNRIKRE
jgi:hypothetical protein